MTGFQVFKWIFYCTEGLWVQLTSSKQLSDIVVCHYHNRETCHFVVCGAHPLNTLTYLWQSLLQNTGS